MTVSVGFVLITCFNGNIWTGGCNGCLNVDNPSNGGLSDLVEQLETLYQDEGYSSLISRLTCFRVLLLRLYFCKTELTFGHWLVSLPLTRVSRMPMKIVTPTTVQSQIPVLFSNGDAKSVKIFFPLNLYILRTVISHAPIWRTVPLHLTPLTMWGYQEVPSTMMGSWTSLPQVSKRQSHHKKSVFRLRLSVPCYIPWCDQTQHTPL